MATCLGGEQEFNPVADLKRDVPCQVILDQHTLHG